MICSECGCEIPQIARFCPKCGKAIKSIDTTTTQNKESINESGYNKPRNKVILLLSLIMVGVLLIGILSLFVVPRVRIKGQISLGNKYLSMKDYDSAIHAYETAIGIDPKSVNAYEGLTKAYLEKGDVYRAERVINLGLSNVNDPGDLHEIEQEVNRRIAEMETLETKQDNREEPVTSAYVGDDEMIQKTISQDEAMAYLRAMKYVFLSMSYNCAEHGTYTAGMDDYWQCLFYLANYSTWNDDVGVKARLINNESQCSLSEADTKQCISAFDCTFNGDIKPIPNTEFECAYDDQTMDYIFGFGEPGEDVPVILGILDNADGTYSIYGGMSTVEVETTDSFEFEGVTYPVLEETGRMIVSDYFKIDVVNNTYTQDPTYMFSIKQSSAIGENEYNAEADKLIPF